MKSVKLVVSIVPAIFLVTIAGCSPEVGSNGWCDDMDEKAKGDWTANEATEYAKNCIFRKDD